MPLVLGPLIKETTEVTGLTSPIRLLGRKTNFLDYTQWLASGQDTIVYLKDGSDPPNVDVWRGVWTPGTGPSGENEVTRAVLIQSTTPGGTNWGAGVKDAYCAAVPGVTLDAALALQEIADLSLEATARNNLALGSIATSDTGDFHAQGDHILLPVSAPPSDLYAASRDWVLNQGVTANLTLATGDEILWAGAFLPPGFSIKTGSQYNDRTILICDTLGETGDFAGDWDWKDALGGDVDTTVLSLAQTPVHEHAVIVFADASNPGADGATVPASLLRTSTGSADKTFTSDSKGGGGGHKHTLTTNTGWKMKHREMAIIAAD